MTDARTTAMQDIERLLAERRKFEQWLAQLDARKESTPGHVFDKVREDYASRLSAVQQKLTSESGAVRTLAAEVEESAAAKAREIAERTDELAEAELRASVGEFAGKEWEKLRTRLDGAIAELAGERDTMQRELDTLRSVLAQVAPSSDVPRGGDVDDLAFLRSVLGRPITPTNTPVLGTPLPHDAPPAPLAEAPTAPAQPLTTTPISAPISISIPTPVSTPTLTPISTPTPTHTPTHTPSLSPSITARQTPLATDTVKSLKCQECGTMNFPTEWYCERCGGELAAF